LQAALRHREDYAAALSPIRQRRRLEHSKHWPGRRRSERRDWKPRGSKRRCKKLRTRSNERSGKRPCERPSKRSNGTLCARRGSLTKYPVRRSGSTCCGVLPCYGE
jgi:hypothetical protein